MLCRHPAADRARRGAAAVETAVVLSLTFLLVLGVFEYGRFLMVFNMTEYAAREGARMASVQLTANRTPADIAVITQQISDYTKAAMGTAAKHLDNINVTVTRLDPTTGADAGGWNTAKYAEPVAVRVTGNYRPMLSNIIKTTVPLSLQATTGSEAN
ncbi:MAG TPA: TadE/TadG family type IV pilus assembly protein [Gemmataceae bacterium]|jgi:Flp pilus assembly protein TadG